MISESEINNRISNNKELALKMLFENYSDLCFTICIRYLNIKEEAEEMVHNGFVKAFQNMEKFHFKGEGSLKAWLKKIVVNECLMNLRSQKSFKTMWVDDFVEADIEMHDFENLQYKDILKLINELPIHLKTVFNMYEIEGYSHAEIAGILGVSAGTSKSSLSRAKVALRAKFILNGY